MGDRSNRREDVIDERGARISPPNMEDKIKELEEENRILHNCLESVSAFEKEMHDNSLKVAKDIVKRDRKAIANIILNMGFGNRYNVSFCEIFELKNIGGCEQNKRCTDCIHEFLEKQFQ